MVYNTKRSQDCLAVRRSAPSAVALAGNCPYFTVNENLKCSPCVDCSREESPAEEDYGFFDVIDDAEEEYETLSVLAVTSKHTESISSSSSSPVRSTSILQRVHCTGVSLSVKLLEGKEFAWAVGGFRIVRNGVRSFCEFQVITSFGEETLESWIRSSEFAKFEGNLIHAVAGGSAYAKVCESWDLVLKHQRTLWNLEVEYLQQRAYLLSQFLKNVLFGATDPQQLLDFVRKSVPRQTRRRSNKCQRPLSRRAGLWRC